jgi:8-oxo-dGTP pyrophosphatase MutT (NUDIX family)
MNVKKSYGIILCRKNTRDGAWEVLAVKKRNTYAFVEFILRTHHRNNENDILQLLNGMTYDEKVDLLSLNFGQIWHRFQLINPDLMGSGSVVGMSMEDYDKFKAKKLNFERTFLSDKGKLLKKLISKSRHSTNGWELPKGRRNGPELELNCAIREITEETGLLPVDYNLLVHEPTLRLVQQAAYFKYESYYYIGVMENHRFVPNFLEKLATGKPCEISEVQWMTLNKLSVVDPSNKLQNVARDALTIVRKKYKYDKIIADNDLLKK